MEGGGDAGVRGGDLEDEDGAGEVRKISIQLMTARHVCVLRINAFTINAFTS